METSNVEILRRTRKIADETKHPIATHAAYSILAFHDVVHEYQMTQIELLNDLGLLRPTLNIKHGLNYSVARDLELMGKSGARISHCATIIVRRGRTLDS